MTFVAPNLAWGEARGGSIPRQWGCDRRATKPQAKFGATLRAAVLFGPGGVARSLQIHEGYARRSRLAWAENSSPQTSSNLRPGSLRLKVKQGTRRDACPPSVDCFSQTQ